MERIGIFSIEDVLSKCIDPLERKSKDRKREFLVNGVQKHSVNMTSWRYWVFKHKGIVCGCCGKKGAFFSLEKGSNQPKTLPYHFNLYDGDPNDENTWVLMTKDHIIPKSKNGKDHLDNFQTLCTICNCLKGDN